jgi:hypothetical protein
MMMTRRWIITPIAAMAVVAGYLGLKLGQPVTESQIIMSVAQTYVDDQGGDAQISDCLALPDLRTNIRRVVRCTHPNGITYSYYAGQRGDVRGFETSLDPKV